MRTRVRWGRVLFAIALLGASIAMQVYSATVDAQVPDDEYVTASGGGEDIEAAVDLWSGALRGGALIDAGRTGSLTGRANLAEGNADFSFSSLPFTPSDLTALQRRGATAIEAPLAVTGMAFTYGTRTGAPMEQSAEDPFVNPDAPFSAVDRPVRIPAGVIARTMLNLQTQPLETDPEFTAEFAPNFLVPQSDRPFGVVRSDSDASNRYLLEFVKRNADKVSLPDVPALNPITPAESFPLGYGTSFKQGEDQLARGLLDRKVDTTGGGSIVPMIVGMSPSRTNKTLLTSAEAEPGKGTTSSLYPIAVKNGLNQWVTATSESLTKAAAGAVAAAGSGSPAPLWGLAETTPDVDGAYPMSWTVNIQLPTSGLSPAKTTALATFLRYATSETGQTAAAGAGYGRLPNPLVLQAAVKADQLVTSNCTGADRKLVVAADGGPYWPAGVAAPAGGFRVCEAIPGATPVATEGSEGSNGANGASNNAGSNRASSSTGPGSSSSGRSSSSFSPGGSSYDSSFDTDVAGVSEFADDGSLSGTADEGGAADTLDVAAVSANLPLPLPDDGRSTLDRLATMVLGGAAFLMLRSAFRSRTVPS